MVYHGRRSVPWIEGVQASSRGRCRASMVRALRDLHICAAGGMRAALGWMWAGTGRLGSAAATSPVVVGVVAPIG